MTHRFTLLLLTPLFLFPSFSLAKTRLAPEGFCEDLSLQALQDRAFEAQLPYLVYIQDAGKRKSKRMRKTTWADEGVREIIEDHFLAAVYSPYDEGEQVELISQYKVYGFPSLLIFSPDGTLLGKSEGFLAPETMTAILNKHLSQLQYKADMMAMSGIVSRGESYQPVSRSGDFQQMTPPLLVGSMMKFSSPDATLTAASIRDLTPVGSLTTFGHARGQEEEVREAEIATPITLPSQMNSEANTSEETLLLDVPGMEAYSLRQLREREEQAEVYGLLVGSYVSFDKASTEVARFERLWRDRIFVYCEEVEGTLIYRVILGEYLDEEVAKAFSKAIYKMEGINPTIIPLAALL